MLPRGARRLGAVHGRHDGSCESRGPAHAAAQRDLQGQHGKRARHRDPPHAAAPRDGGSGPHHARVRQRVAPAAAPRVPAAAVECCVVYE